MIEVQGLRHCFGRREVLRDLTFSLEKGGFAFLTGPSGAGKSTLLRILHGSLPLQEGRAVAAGHDLAGLRPSKLHQLRRDVAMVFQDFKILPERSVADNVALPLVVRGTPAARIERRVRSALTALRLTELADRPEPSGASLPRPFESLAPLAEVVAWLREYLGVTEWSEDESVRRTGSKRCSNARAKALGWVPKYPSYREGYAAILEGRC